jgi:hypothetical protein
VIVVEVRIRHVNDIIGRRLCDWPAGELERLIATIKAWGLADADETSIHGQFVLSDDAAYFELVFESE